MPENFLPRMIAMARQGGEIARAMIAESSPTLKPDSTVVTRADLAVSSYIREQIQSHFDSGHLLLDEEDIRHREYCDAGVLERASYIWVTDPIDGTRPFSNQMPFYGISIGVLKDLRPWLGVVYLPELGQLFYSDGESAYFVQDPFTSAEKCRQIKPLDQEITAQSIFFLCDTFFRKYNWDYAFCPVMLPACAVIDLCWPAVGRGCGCFFNAHIWDFAGSWPIFQAAGLQLRSFPSGEVLDRLDLRFFRRDGPHPWRLKDDYILSSPRNFPLIRDNIQART